MEDAAPGSRLEAAGFRIYSLVLESQPPHKTVNLLLTTTSQNTKLTVLWGS
jgi:hypothetical protein